MNFLQRASEMLMREAQSIRQSHTIEGQWPERALDALIDHNEMLSVAADLREANRALACIRDANFRSAQSVRLEVARLIE